MGMKTAVVLRRARKYLVKYGWIQGKPGGKEGGFCALGAINEATGSEALRTLAQRYLCAATERGYPVNPDAIVWRWNDQGGRAKVDVLKAFTKAAKLAEKDKANP